MRVYLAAPYAARDLMREHAEQLTFLDLDVVCCSSWLAEGYEINAGTTGPASALEGEAVDGHVEQDLADIAAADVVVAFTAASLGLPVEAAASGGRHVETGYALALRMPVLVVGEPENIFHRSGRVTRVRDWSTAVGLLGSMAVRWQRLAAALEVEQVGCPVCAEASR